MTGPHAVDLEAARAALRDLRCPMSDDPTEVVASQKLTTLDKATAAADFLGRRVPVRDAVIVRCTDEDCPWGMEVVDERGGRVHAGLGYEDVPPPHAGDEQ